MSVQQALLPSLLLFHLPPQSAVTHNEARAAETARVPKKPRQALRHEKQPLWHSGPQWKGVHILA